MNYIKVDMTLSRDLSGLTPDFRSRVENMLAICVEMGAEYVLYCGARSPLQQAVLWRRGHGREEVDQRIRVWETDAPFLAGCLRAIGPQYGRAVKAALPGYSFHQWREAGDFYRKLNGGQISWEPDVYDVLHDAMSACNLFSVPGDANHIQMRGGTPLSNFPRDVTIPPSQVTISTLDMELRNLWPVEHEAVFNWLKSPDQPQTIKTRKFQITIPEVGDPGIESL